MLKKLALAAIIILVAGSSYAAVGVAPTSGPALQDGIWLNGLAGGLNYSYQYGISAAGTTQAGATQLPSGSALLELDTVAASSGIALPPCLPGTGFSLYNNGANTVTVYPSVSNNPITAAQDTINNGTTLSGGIATHTAELFFCVKAGVWAAK